MALLAPGGLLEVVFSFDTTGSMYSCLEQVRGRINDMIQRLQTDIPGIRTAVIAHGDYCDAAIYVTKWIDFTTNVADLCDFVTNAERTSGGDGPECYELVLQQTRLKLSWTPGSRRVLVLIGDDEPHGIDYPANTEKIDWKYETKELALMDVTIYPVQCGNNGINATAFYKTLSTVTGGKHLKLDDFGNMFDVLMAVCYREGNDTSMLTSYEKEVRARCGSAAIGKDIDAIFASLRDDDASGSSSVSDISVTAKPAPLKTKTSVVKTKVPKVKRLMTKTPLKSPSRRKSSLKGKSFAKKTSLLDKYRQENLPLQKRENVPETYFGLRTLSWTPWTLILSPDLPEGTEKMWEKRRGMPGYRLTYLRSNKKVQHNEDRKVLFEVAVQTPGSGRQRHVVHSAFSTRCFHNKQWEMSILRGVRQQLNKRLNDGCKIFIRFHSLSTREDVSSLRSSLKRYDYAWKSIRNVRSGPREATKGSNYISMDLD